MTVTFSTADQRKHRTSFINECRQKAWGAACNADWIGKQADQLMEQYRKLSDEHRGITEEIDKLANGLGSNTKENYDKRKQLRQRADALADSMNGIAASTTQMQKAMQQLYANAEQNLALAKHAAEWEWKEVEAAKPASE